MMWWLWQRQLFCNSEATLRMEAKIQGLHYRPALLPPGFFLRGKHFADKGPCSQSCGFPIVMYEYMSWTIKKIQRTDAFKLWCWRRLLRVAWRTSIQSILKEINPDYSLEGLMLMLKFQYFGHLMWRPNFLEKTLILGKSEGRRKRGRQRMRCLDGVTDSMDMNFSKLQEIVKGREAWRAAVHGATKGQTWLSNWSTTTEEKKTILKSLFFSITSSQIHFLIEIQNACIHPHSPRGPNTEERGRNRQVFKEKRNNNKRLLIPTAPRKIPAQRSQLK